MARGLSGAAEEARSLQSLSLLLSSLLLDVEVFGFSGDGMAGVCSEAVLLWGGGCDPVRSVLVLTCFGNDWQVEAFVWLVYGLGREAWRSDWAEACAFKLVAERPACCTSPCWSSSRRC